MTPTSTWIYKSTDPVANHITAMKDAERKERHNQDLEKENRDFEPEISRKIEAGGGHFEISGITARFGVVSEAKFGEPVSDKYTGKYLPNARMRNGALDATGEPTTRVTSGKPTVTQEILDKHRNGDPVELTELIDGPSNSVDLDRDSRLKMINDPVRRSFESYYAGMALEKAFSNPETAKRIYDFSASQVDYLKLNYCSPEIAKKFDEAVRGDDFSYDKQLGGFYERVKLEIDTLNVTNEAKDILFTVYLNRYLSLSLRNDPETVKNMPEGHWDGIFDMFKGPGKGRNELKGTMHDIFAVSQSYNVGIMRAGTEAPRDLQLVNPYVIEYEQGNYGDYSSGKKTRCPDRLFPSDTMEPETKITGSFTNKLFNSGVGTYINGPSGTILIEHGAIRAAKEIHINRSACDIKEYLEVQGLMFIYLDGGHSMHEIIAALNEPSVSEKLKSTFGGNYEFEMIGDEMFKDRDVLEASATKAAQFYESLKAKDCMHEALLKKFTKG
ncbi:hypothetical protein [Burkholderia stabilis]|uniref:hypothetical protein n=1 Tax=Burkholderia stabilis TaxID=95485 RepID=UPI001010FBA2|nr:hypothetical protein [Burkholderia stabilis]